MCTDYRGHGCIPPPPHSPTGLVALCSEEVLEVMAEDHTQRYSEYVEVIREREFQETLRTKMMEARRMTAASALLGMQVCVCVCVSVWGGVELVCVCGWVGLCECGWVGVNGML